VLRFRGPKEKLATSLQSTRDYDLRLTGNDQKRLSKGDTDNTEAYQLYLKGRYYWNKITEEAIVVAGLHG
jgi:hypothetical protein